MVFFNPNKHVKDKSLFLLDKNAKKDIMDHIEKVNGTTAATSEITSMDSETEFSGNNEFGG